MPAARINNRFRETRGIIPACRRIDIHAMERTASENENSIHVLQKGGQPIEGQSELPSQRTTGDRLPNWSSWKLSISPSGSASSGSTFFSLAIRRARLSFLTLRCIFLVNECTSLLPRQEKNPLDPDPCRVEGILT